MNVYGNTIDFEHIAVQPLKKTEEALSIMEDIVTLVEANTKANSNALMKVVNDLSKEMSKLFGYRISIIHGESFATYIVPHNKNENNAILGNLRNRIDYYSNLDIDGSKELDYNSSEKDMEMVLSETFRSLKTVGISDAVKINLNNATITGLPKEYTQVVVFNFADGINKIGMNARELMGILLHEIGHVYNYFISLTAGYYNSLLITDTIKKEYLGRGTSPRDVILLVADKMSLKIPNKENKNSLELIMNIVTEVVKTSTNSARVEAEFTSDVFAARFGYGPDLMSGLGKLGKRYGVNSETSFVGIGLIMMGLSIFLLFIPLIRNSEPLLLSLLNMGLMGLLMIMTSYKAKYNGGMGEYDNDPERLNRLRQQTINTLKSTNLNNDDIRSIIAQVDFITDTLKVKSMKNGMFEKVMLKFSKEKRAIAVNYLVEELLNSNLNLSSARIKTI